MKRLNPIASSSLFYTPRRTLSSSPFKCLHTTAPTSATALPITTAGPPPPAPLPAASDYRRRLERRQRQAELLKRGQDLRASQMKPGSAMKKRFWKDVSVKTTPEGHHIIHLDARPVRNPSTKTPLPIPSSKPHLASAIALEWDLLISAQQATRSHLLPLTSIASRAHDISLQDASPSSKIRAEIINNLSRYLDTDTLLCWAPETSEPDSLREIQIRTAQPIITYLTQYVWPGIELKPAIDTLSGGSILPINQPAATHAVIKGWMAGLPAWELAGLERAVLAGKSLCVGARLVVEWSEEFRDVGRGERTFGIEEAAEACSLEVRWQTSQWGEVEDTHDVEKEDLRRQMGSVILVVGGMGRR